MRETRRRYLPLGHHITLAEFSLYEQALELTEALARIRPRIAQRIRAQFTDAYALIAELDEGGDAKVGESDEARLRDLRDNWLLPALCRAAPRGAYVGLNDVGGWYVCEERTRVVCGAVGPMLYFLKEHDAAARRRLQRALKTAQTWGQFRRLCSTRRYVSDYWNEAVERYNGDFDEDGAFADDEEGPPGNTPFDPYEIYGYGDGDWPRAANRDDEVWWIPSPILEQFGHDGASMISGGLIDFYAADEAGIVAALARYGFRCIRDDKLIRAALGYAPDP